MNCRLEPGNTPKTLYLHGNRLVSNASQTGHTRQLEQRVKTEEHDGHASVSVSCFGFGAAQPRILTSPLPLADGTGFPFDQSLANWTNG